jgi:hypothetical protein
MCQVGRRRAFNPPRPPRPLPECQPFPCLNRRYSRSRYPNQRVIQRQLTTTRTHRVGRHHRNPALQVRFPPLFRDTTPRRRLSPFAARTLPVQTYSPCLLHRGPPQALSERINHRPVLLALGTFHRRVHHRIPSRHQESFPARSPIFRSMRRTRRRRYGAISRRLRGRRGQVRIRRKRSSRGRRGQVRIRRKRGSR